MQFPVVVAGLSVTGLSSAPAYLLIRWALWVQTDCSYNTPHLENEDPSCSVGVLTQSSSLNTSYNPYPANTQCFPLYDGETSSSQISMFSQNQHDHCPSHSTSLLFVQDLGATDSSSINHDLMSFVNDQQQLDKLHIKERDNICSRFFLFTFYLCTYIFSIYLLPHFTHFSYPGTLLEYIDFGDKTFKCCHCKALFWLNERLTQSTQSNPRFYLCCLSGKSKLPQPLPTPQLLDNLLNNIFGQKCKKFRANIRAYNSMFAFTSMGATLVNRQSGPYIFKINGHCHHLMGSLLPSNESAPKFAQLYIYDVANEVSNRMSQFPHSTSTSSLDETIVGDLIQMLASTNCLVGLFRHASQKLSEPTNPGYKLQLLCQRTNDTRKYNDPTSDDIGGLIIGDIGDYQSERDIIIETSSNILQRISKLHPKFMALQYPLLFPLVKMVIELTLVLQIMMVISLENIKEYQ
uniref:Helitron helicase-like domain-containing protein n=1 Tax=Salix viminalis TaxID=40686 RepID=A0A6N2KNL2_SALVM